MSVPKDCRTEGVLNVNVKTKDLALYTIRITGNPKWFPQEQQRYIELLQRTALNIYVLCWRANNIKVGKSRDLFDDRMGFQIQAINLCNDMQALIELAKPLFHLTSKRTRYWVKSTVEVRGLIRGWHESDMNRLRP